MGREPHQNDGELMPPDLQRVLDRYTADVDELMDRLESRAVTPEQWRRAMKQLLARYHTAALMVGMGTDQLTTEAIALLTKTLEEGQIPYLENFYTVVAAAPEFNNAWRARARLYALSPKTSYWEGDVYRQTGRFLPLPAMPAQGVQCHTNCKCSWRIEELDQDNGDYDAYWIRQADDSCQTCIEREEQWSPVRIRGGDLQL